MAKTVRTSSNVKKKVCSSCGSESFYDDPRRGELVCTSCGCVATERQMDTGPEWRAFTTEERNARARAGAPMTFTIADKGLATTISRINRDASGRSIKGGRRASIYRMRKWQIRSWAHGSKQNNLRLAMTEMDRLTSQLGIPRKTKETAAHVYRKALNKRLVRGRTIEGIVAASIYLSCRIHRIPRQLDEIVEESRVTRRELGNCVRLILRYVDVKVPLASATDLIPRISSDLKVEGKTVRRATSIITDAKKKGITIGKDPGGIAAAALYIAGIIENDRRTQREIAEASNVTEVTVRNRYKDLVKSLEISLI